LHTHSGYSGRLVMGKSQVYCRRIIPTGSEYFWQLVAFWFCGFCLHAAAYVECCCSGSLCCCC